MSASSNVVSSSGTTSDGQKVIIVEKPVQVNVPMPLQDDTAPKLSADLDARGFNIIGVKNLQCDTVNGTSVKGFLTDTIKVERSSNEERFAPKNHTHPEFKKIEAVIDAKIAEAAPKEEYALKSHTHPAVTTQLANIERGNEMKAVLDMEICPMQHSHPKVDEAILKLQADVAALKEQVALMAKSEIVDEMHLRTIGEISKVRQENTTALQKVKESIPRLPPERVELTGARYCAIPFKCAGKKLSDMLLVDLEGNKVNASVTCKGAAVKVGQSFGAGAVISIPPNTLALFQFS